MSKTSIETCNEQCRIAHESKTGCKVKCGCGGDHKMEQFGEQIVHYFGQHWLLECLTKHLIAKRAEDNNAIRLITHRMQKYQDDIAKMYCSGPTCTQKVGKTYRMVGSAVFCVHCSYDIGAQ